MGIAQIALEPPSPLFQTGKLGKKVPQTILASPYTPGHKGASQRLKLMFEHDTRIG